MNKNWLIFSGLSLGLFMLAMLVLSVGSVTIPWLEVLSEIFLGESANPLWKTVILQLRLPRILTALVAGAALSVSGLQMQTLFQNPLAGPYVLGISAGAGLGVALASLAQGWGSDFLLTSQFGFDLGITGAAVLGSAVVLTLVLIAARWVQNVVSLLILGLMLATMVSSLVSVLIYFSEPDAVKAYLVWSFGSFRNTSWEELGSMSAIVLIGMTLSVMLIKILNAFLLGEEYAQSMGHAVRPARYLILASTALMTGAVTAVCGPIGFLGVAVPHLCRGLFNTSDHRVLLPATLLMGAGIALLAEWVAQIPGSAISLPINAITALLGAPVVIWVILKRNSMM